MSRAIVNADVRAPEKRREFYYLATPYSKYPGGLETAHDAACRFAARLIDAGWPIFCPIAHTHHIAKHMTHDPRDSAFWIQVNQGPLEAAAGLIVAMMPGWQESDGIADETAFFERTGRPVIPLDPDQPADALARELDRRRRE